MPHPLPRASAVHILWALLGLEEPALNIYVMLCGRAAEVRQPDGRRRRRVRQPARPLSKQGSQAAKEASMRWKLSGSELVRR